MRAFELADLISQRTADGKGYVEFLRVPDLSMGLYVLPAGGADPQSAHTEDEVYHVLSGRAHLTVGEEDGVIGPGSIIYVAKNVEHRIHSIEADLTLLVFFAPAEYSQKKT